MAYLSRLLLTMAHSLWLVNLTPSWNKRHQAYSCGTLPPFIEWVGRETLKKGLKASVNSGQDVSFQLSNFLLTYWSTSHATIKQTPSQFFLGWSLCTWLDLLCPQWEATVLREQSRQKIYSDQHTHARELHVNQRVVARNECPGMCWVLEEQVSPLTYQSSQNYCGVITLTIYVVFLQTQLQLVSQLTVMLMFNCALHLRAQPLPSVSPTKTFCMIQTIQACHCLKGHHHQKARSPCPPTVWRPPHRCEPPVQYLMTMYECI